MLVKKGYEYRLYPSKDEATYISKIAGCTRKVYNLLLDQAQKDYAAYKLDPLNTPKPKVSSYDFINKLPELKANQEYSYLKDVPAVALQQSAMHLGQAYTNTFRRLKVKAAKPGFPKFKSRNNYRKFTLTKDAFFIKNKRLHIAKLDTGIEVRWGRKLPSVPSSITITITPSGKYFVSFLCETPPKVTNGSGIVGLDFGITNLIVTSDGELLTGPKATTRYQKLLKRASCFHSRKVKGSKNCEKSRVKLARLHERIGNLRKDYAEQVSRRLVNRNRLIVIEQLKVANMLANHKLAKGVHDAAFASLARAFTRKVAESHWATIVLADTFFPSTRLCCNCHTKSTVKVKLGVKKWDCSVCGTTHDRDFNASFNLKKLGELAINYHTLKPGTVTKIGYDGYREMLAENVPMDSRLAW